MEVLEVTSAEMCVPNLRAYKVLGDDMTLESIRQLAWELDDLDGRDSIQHPEWQALCMQFTSSHVLGTVPYRWESQARTYTHAQLLEVEFDSLNVVVLDGPLLYDGGVCAEEKAAAVKVHLKMCSDQKGRLMHELGKRGKAALVRETEEEWELLVPHNLLSQLSFSEKVIARWRRHQTRPVSSHWQDAEQVGTDLWKRDDTVETPCIPDLDLSWLRHEPGRPVMEDAEEKV